MPTETMRSCPACGAGLSRADSACPMCHRTVSRLDELEAVDYAIAQFQRWANEWQLTEPERKAIAAKYQPIREQSLRSDTEAGASAHSPSRTGLPARHVCWQCQKTRPAQDKACRVCLTALDTATAREMRFLMYLTRQITDLAAEGIIPLSKSHLLLRLVKQRFLGLRSRLERFIAPLAKPVDAGFADEFIEQVREMDQARAAAKP